MRGFRRRKPGQVIPAAGAAVEQLGGTGQSPIGHADPPSNPRAALRRIAAEAVILQDEAEAVVRGARAREGLGFLAPVVDRWYAASSVSEICSRRPVRTLRTKNCAASWMRSCTTTPWLCGLPWIYWLASGDRKGSLASWTHWMGSGSRPFSLISSMPSSRNDRLPMNEQRSGLRPASAAEKAAGRQDRGMPLHPSLTGRCSVRFDPPPAPPQTGWIWESRSEEHT